jgi:hypothetical protein
MYNAKAPYYFKNYIGFQHYAISNLNNLAFQLFEKIKKPTLEFLMYKPKRNKFVSSPLIF